MNLRMLEEIYDKPLSPSIPISLGLRKIIHPDEIKEYKGFKLNDRVRCIEDYGIITVGYTGTIVYFTTTTRLGVRSVGVFWDNDLYKTGHDFKGQSPYIDIDVGSQGTYIGADFIEKLKNYEM